MRAYVVVDLMNQYQNDKITIFHDAEEAYKCFEDLIYSLNLDEDVTQYINEMNYKDKIFLSVKDIDFGYYQSDSDFLKFTLLLDSLGLDEQTAFRIFIKKCLKEDGIPFEIK